MNGEVYQRYDNIKLFIDEEMRISISLVNSF